MANRPKEKFEYEVDKYWFKFSNFIGLAFGSFCIWFSFIKSDDDFFQMRGIEVSRVDDPILFWFNILFCFSGGVLFIYLGLGPFFHWVGKRLPNKQINQDK
ncbi:hypothetical protein [Colwellia sp. Arc7-D]|uniref:hypothetical protein n=1 Tax=Colwellia sp. Arc7-D TaxID=2161872 RepID=UPI000D332EE0|nr:hypothetical protein [Colwellia sp. Arc7-D]AWB57591.1 hypothetical protein DBO93_08470 [Colwellia sp. Arc7-D]